MKSAESNTKNWKTRFNDTVDYAYATLTNPIQRIERGDIMSSQYGELSQGIQYKELKGTSWPPRAAPPSLGIQYKELKDILSKEHYEKINTAGIQYKELKDTQHPILL